MAVVSGRPLAFLISRLPVDRLDVTGLYGLEHLVRGRPDDLLGSERWLGPVTASALAARAEGPPGLGVEEKGPSLTLHYRSIPDHRNEVEALAADLGARFGLSVRAARMSVELHPTEAPDKGTVVTGLVQGASAACYLGDDVGDVPAFDALTELVVAGELAMAVRIVAESSETPAELRDRADVVVDGPAGAVAWLEALGAEGPGPEGSA